MEARIPRLPESKKDASRDYRLIRRDERKGGKFSERKERCLFISNVNFVEKNILHQSRWIKNRLKMLLILFKIIVSNASKLVNLLFTVKKICSGKIKI